MARMPQKELYRRELVDTISDVFPSQWFSQFSSHGNSEWTPQKIFWVSAVMSWQPQVMLREQFDAAGWLGSGRRVVASGRHLTWL